MILDKESGVDVAQGSSVIFRRDGSIITDIWGGRTWREITDKQILSKISNIIAKRTSVESVRKNEFWGELQKMPHLTISRPCDYLLS